MKKLFLFLAVLGSSLVFSQKKIKRVGINTRTPRATMEIARDPSLPVTQPQGVLFPSYTTAQRNAFDASKLVAGMMLYNTDKKCIELWNGTTWACTHE